MEDSEQQELQQEPLPEQPELEYKNNEDQGDIRRRLRDRDLLKKRKAEAEEKETDQWDFGTESPKKRGRSGAKRGRRRGRPRKTEPTESIDYQNETAMYKDTSSIIMGAILGQMPSSQEAQLVSTPPSAATPVFEQLNPASQDPVTAFEPTVDAPPVSVQDMAPVPDAVPLPPAIQEPVEVQPMYTEPQSKAELNQILIEDLGPDEEEDLSAPEDKQVGEDKELSEKPVIMLDSTFLSTPSLPSSPPQEYVPRNSF